MNDNNGLDDPHLPVEDDAALLKAPLLEKSEVVEGTASDDCQSESSSPSDVAEEHSRFRGHFLLAFVAFLFSTLNVSLRLLYSLPGPPSASALSTTRGWMALACFLPFLARKKATPTTPRNDNEMESPRRSMWIAAAELAFWNFTCQATFTLGLLTTPSARASFLGQTSVVLVPLIAACTGEKLRSTVWLGCVASLLGLFLLSYADSSTSSSVGFGIGDLLVLCGALLWSFYVVRLSAIGSLYDDVYLQGTKTFYVALLYTVWFIISSLRTDTCLWSGWDNPFAWAILFYSALGPGTIADLFQQRGQETVASTESILILSLEPVFTAIFGRLILGEETSWLEKLGGGFLILGALVANR